MSRSCIALDGIVNYYHAIPSAEHPPDPSDRLSSRVRPQRPDRALDAGDLPPRCTQQHIHLAVCALLRVHHPEHLEKQESRMRMSFESEGW